MNNLNKVQLAASLVAALGLGISSAARAAEPVNGSQLGASEKNSPSAIKIAKKGKECKKGDKECKEGEKGKEGSCKAKEGEKGKEGSCKAKDEAKDAGDTANTSDDDK
jgi:hypothetical protein